MNDVVINRRRKQGRRRAEGLTQMANDDQAQVPLPIGAQGASMEPLLTTAEVAKLLRVHPATVCRWRLEGGGPRLPVIWLSSHAPRYRRADVERVLVGDAV
jgi:hypothetical protein